MMSQLPQRYPSLAALALAAWAVSGCTSESNRDPSVATQTPDPQSTQPIAAPATTVPAPEPRAATGGAFGALEGTGRASQPALGAAGAVMRPLADPKGKEPAVAPASPPDGAWSVAQLIARAPDPKAPLHVVGRVAYQRPCPCPPGAACKPCDPVVHVIDGPETPAGQGLVITGIPSSAQLSGGQRYSFDGYGFQMPSRHSVPNHTLPDPHAEPALPARAEMIYSGHQTR